MTCFHPNLMECVKDPATGSLVYRFLGPAASKDPREYGTMDDLASPEIGPSRDHYFFQVPCGKCVGCKIDYSRNWANRMILELRDSGCGIFLTLTYNDDSLPKNGFGDHTLSKRDLQLFWKKLRKAFPDVRIRYFVAGEYGPKTLRPHYHAIVYGLSVASFPDAYVQRFNNLGQPLYTSPALARIWGNGFILFSDVTWHTCSYVSRYVLKKGFGLNEYGDEGVVPEFVLSSRKPGIGLLNYRSYIQSGLTHFSVDGRDGIYSLPLPKAFLSKAKRDGLDIDQINSIMRARSDAAHDSLLSSVLLSEKAYADYLRDCEAELLAKLKGLDERSL